MSPCTKQRNCPLPLAPSQLEEQLPASLHGDGYSSFPFAQDP